MKTLKRILYLLTILIISNDLAASVWQRKIINYERSLYKGGFQNWKIDQSDRGLIYIANSNGLLEFDGVNWHLYNVRNKVMRAVKAIGNRIYVGGSSEFGYFETNAMGVLVYHSMSNQIPEWRGELWNIFSIDDNIYFVDDRNIFIYNNKGTIVKTIAIDFKIDCSALINKTLYIGSTGGIFYLNNNNSLDFLHSSEALKDTKIVSLLPYNGEICVVTAQSGIYSIDNVHCEKVDFVTDNFIQDNQLFSASITNNQIVLGSVQNGVFIIDLKNPTHKEQFNLENGLKNNTILSSFFDKEQNLWLALDKGIAYIDLESPMRPLFAKDSPIGTGYCSIMYNNELFLGTNQGLYKQSSDGNYQLVKGSEGQIWSLSVHDGLLFSAGDNQVLAISPTETYKINLPGVWEINTLSAQKDKLIAGLYSGLAVLEKKNNRWQFSNLVSNTNQHSGRGFMEDDVSTNFWIADEGGDIYKITLNSDLTDTLAIKRYTIKGTSVGENVFFRKIDNTIIVCTLNGIYQYNRISDNFIRYPQLESVLEGQKYYEYLFVDWMNNIWFVSDNNLKLTRYTPKHGYAKHILNLGLENELVDKYQHISVINSSTAIISVDNAFVKADLNRLNNETPFNIFISKLIATGNDSVKTFGSMHNIPIVLGYTENSVSIHFSTTNFSQASNVLYSYRLKNIDEKWSIPSAQTYKEYTNLYEGSYLFEVKAFVKGDQQSANITSIEFTILPPWYRTTWAYISYMLLIFGTLYFIYKKTVSKQKKIVRQKKEELVLQRLLHEEERREKDNEIYILQNENLKTELHYKTQELSGYILNVIKKNEVLEELKKGVQNISKSIDEHKEPNILKQKVVRLISYINNSIEQDVDFKVFESNFNVIHRDFFKLLDEKYPQLTRNDKILCAYLKMNFSSKEIAPLLNISVRGVEVSRYRLRKKMNLDRDENLAEFMQSL